MECILLYEGFTVLLFYTLHGRPHERDFCPLKKSLLKNYLKFQRLLSSFEPVK